MLMMPYNQLNLFHAERQGLPSNLQAQRGSFHLLMLAVMISAQQKVLQIITQETKKLTVTASQSD